MPGRSYSFACHAPKENSPTALPTVFPAQLPVCCFSPVSALKTVLFPVLGLPAKATRRQCFLRHPTSPPPQKYARHRHRAEQSAYPSPDTLVCRRLHIHTAAKPDCLGKSPDQTDADSLLPVPPGTKQGHSTGISVSFLGISIPPSMV